MTAAAVYLRVSKSDDSDDESLTKVNARMRVVQEVQDEQASGGTSHSDERGRGLGPGSCTMTLGATVRHTGSSLNGRCSGPLRHR